MKMRKEILTDESIYPDEKVLKSVLGPKKYRYLSDFIDQISKINLTTEWRFYHDAKGWLCKIWHKKKNLAWLSVWDTGVRVTVYFRHKPDGFDHIETAPSGRSIAFINYLDSQESIAQVIALLSVKMQQK